MKNKGNDTIKEHYVPEFYLKRFNDLDNMLWVYDAKSDKKFRARAKDICYKNDVYEVKWKDANPDMGEYILRNDVEKEFGVLEQKTSKFFIKLDKVITNNQNQDASICINGEKRLLFSIMANFIFRNPKTLEEYKITEIKDDFLNESGLKQLCDVLDEMGIGGGKSLITKAKEKAFLLENEGSPISSFIERLKLLSFEFFYAKEGQFITSDVPVSCGHDDSIVYSNKACLFFPISPKIAVLFGNYDLKKNKMISINKEIVDEFNKAYIGTEKTKKNLIICNNKKQRDELATYMRNK